MKVDWYFDFISPFAYLAHELFAALPASLVIERRPVLFAGLLGHWGQLGPAEIPGKRLAMYRHCTWMAEHYGIPFAVPAPHPFPPLLPLRLALACDARPEAVAAIFRHLWVGGHDPNDPERLAELRRTLAASGPVGDPEAPGVKQRLREQTDEAARRGVFGVPTAVVHWRDEDLLFWGFDSLGMLGEFAADPQLFDAPAMRRLVSLPVGAVRPRP